MNKERAALRQALLSRYADSIPRLTGLDLRGRHLHGKQIVLLGCIFDADLLVLPVKITVELDSPKAKPAFDPRNYAAIGGPFKRRPGRPKKARQAGKEIEDFRLPSIQDVHGAIRNADQT